MLDVKLRRVIDPPVNRQPDRRVACRLGDRGRRYDGGRLRVGVAAWIALAVQAYAIALLLVLLNRLCDGLDGAVARHGVVTNRGGYLDIVLDFIFYAGTPFFFAVGQPEAALPAAFLIFSFMGTASSFLALAIFAAKRGLATSVRGRESLYYLVGLTEGTETILLFVLICIAPSWFAPTAWVFGGLCWISAASRIAVGVTTFSDYARDHVG